MMKKNMLTMKKLLLVVTMIALTMITVQVADAIELVTNGGFETGNFMGWTRADSGPGSFVIDDADGFTPLSGLPTVGPAGGMFYAVSDDSGSGTHALEQTFAVPGPALSVILSFDMYVSDFIGIGAIINPAGLDHTAVPNQHARVDILSGGSAPFDTGAGVLDNLFIGVDAPAVPTPYTSYLFDITGIVGGGGSFDLRFAEVNNQFFLNQGVDNVSIDFTPIPVPVPEPSTFLLLGAGLLGITLQRKRIKSKSITS